MTDHPEQTLADRVLKLRKENGWSQKYLAELLPSDVKQKSIDHLERGLVKRPRFLHELAEVFGTSVEWLLSGKEGTVRREISELDVVLLHAVIAGVEERARKIKRKLPREEFMRTIYKTYADMMPGEYMTRIIDRIMENLSDIARSPTKPRE